MAAAEPDKTSGPLDGVRVLDITSVVLGPYATKLLADYGADVIKIEPLDGDIMRQAGPMRNPGMGHLYLSTNRNKRSLAIDLKAPGGRDALLQLARNADAVVYNMRPSAMEKMGLSYEAVKTVNPSIVYAGGFGFSQRGPYGARPAYDDLAQGMSGVAWLTQVAGRQEPAYSPVVIADWIGGMQLALAVVSALFHRKATGQGQRVDVPMYEGMASIVLSEHLAGKSFKPPIGPIGHARSLAHERRPYPTKDGYICVLVYTDKHWRALFNAIGDPGQFTADARFSTQAARARHIEEVYGYLGNLLKDRTTDEWLVFFAECDIPAGRLQTIDDLLDDEHLRAIGFVQSQVHPSEGNILTTAIPTEWSASCPGLRRHAPRLGEHTLEVLREAGLDEGAISLLVESGLVKQAGSAR